MSKLIQTDTIAALATAPLPAGVAVIRISGPQATEAAGALLPALLRAKPRQLVYGTLKNAQQEALDNVLAVWFQAPHSFTGEEVVELHCHGGRAVIQAILTALYDHGVRVAEAGEFSRRAFLNGKLDLTAAEGIADLIGANTEAQRRQALRQLEGELGQRFEHWRQRVLGLLAQVEAAIDFPDEELEILAEASLKTLLDEVLADLRAAVATGTGRRLRDGFQVAILGRPNSGKSTLTNLLSGKETAIVSPLAGTTRDVVEAHLDIAGFPVVLADTAGLRESDDVIEAEGVRRARQRAAQADLVILVVTVDDFPALEASAAAALRPDHSIILVSKTDLAPNHPLPPTLTVADHAYSVIGADLTTATALPPVLTLLGELLQTSYATAGEAAQLTRERHQQAVRRAIEHLERAAALYARPPAGASLADMLAQDLRDAAGAIGSVTGRTDTEAVLDVVFSTFCIGK